ncbi:hypothetical protein SISNIDRAFT_457161 [Sistotremastrum niveocremeum HHB9708]|nr:hypothetical protein SISNIDRAFT_457161 [Sistotremastrum niveocremeum HHB9708]
MYESIINLFNLAVTYIALAPERDRVWEMGIGYLKDAEAGLASTLAALKPDTAEYHIMQLISSVIRLITRIPILGPCDLSTLLKELEPPATTLQSKKCWLFPEMYQAINDFISRHSSTSNGWSSIVNQMTNMESVTSENSKVASIYRIPPSTALFQRAFPAATRSERIRMDSCCAWCHEYSVGLKKCSRCEKVKYCGKGCQKAHWNKSHKSECISPEIPI